MSPTPVRPVRRRAVVTQPNDVLKIRALSDVVKAVRCHNVNTRETAKTHLPLSLRVSVFPCGICRPVRRCVGASGVFSSTWECPVFRDGPREQLTVSPCYFHTRRWRRRASRTRTEEWRVCAPGGG